MKAILNCVLIILIITFLFYHKKSTATTPTNYYYFYYDETDNKVKTGTFTSESDADDFKLAAKWEYYNPIYIKYYTDAETEYGDFPDYLDWSVYVSDLGAALYSWQWAPSPVSLNVDTDNSKSESESIVIKFYDGWGEEYENRSGYTYRCIVKQGEEYFLVYANGSSVKDPYTRILLNSSSYFHAVEVDDGFGNEKYVQWTLSNIPDFNEVHVMSIIKHELGHAFGLAHPNGSDSDWYASIMRKNYVLGTVNDVTNIDLLALDYLDEGEIPPPGNGINETLLNDFCISFSYPNPFNSNTTIEYQLPEKMDIEISIYNVIGQKVRTIFKGLKEEGTHQIFWDGLNDNHEAVTSGVYIFLIRSVKFKKSIKMLLLR